MSVTVIIFLLVGFTVILNVTFSYGYYRMHVNRKKEVEFSEQSKLKFINFLKGETGIDGEESFPLEHIYTSKDNVKWFAFKNPMRMPAMRLIAGESVARQAEMNMDKPTLLKFISKMEKDATEGKIVNMFSTLAMMKERVNWAYEEITLTNLAVTYFVIEGEDLHNINSDVIQKKKEILKSDINAKAFFLTAAYNYTSQFGDITETDTLEFLMEKTLQPSQATV